MSKWIIFIFFVLLISGCGITGEINRTVTTYPDGKIIEDCHAKYQNTSWGTAEARSAHGCDAGGGADGIDNTAMITVPLAVFQTLVKP